MSNRIKIWIFSLCCSLSFYNLGAQTQAFYIGHSLTDQVPDMVKSLSDDHQDVAFDWFFQSIPGASLQWQWGRMAANDYDPIPPHYYGFYHPVHGLPNGNFTALVLTESVPRIDEVWSIGATYDYAELFADYATDFNADTRIFVYEVWHCLNSGTPTGCDFDIDSNPWRQRLDDDLPMWESVVDHLNNELSLNHEVCLIPGGQGLALLYDEIVAGTVPDLNDITDLFSDDIHLTDQGKYFIACIHFAMLTGQNPIGLTHQTQVWWGGNFDAPSPALALRMQEIAWETVTTYPNSCIDQFLSVNNVNVKAIIEDREVLLTTEILCDPTCQYFYWQHSEDGFTFYDLDMVHLQGSDNKVFSHTHRTPVDGSNYYRVKVYDADGQYYYSSIREIRYENSKVEIFPNPAGDFLYIHGADDIQHCAIISMYGTSETIDPSRPVYIGHKPPGMYICRIGSNSYTFIKH